MYLLNNFYFINQPVLQKATSLLGVKCVSYITRVIVCVAYFMFFIIILCITL